MKNLFILRIANNFANNKTINTIHSFFLFFCLIIVSLPLYSQTINICSGDTVSLELPVFNGSLQWQQSPDSATWSDISGATYQPYKLEVTALTYFRAKLTEAACDPGYSPVQKAIIFCISCPGMPTIMDIDGNIYNTVSIGTQCWMRENLKTTKYANSTPLVDGTSAGDITGNYTTKYYFDYANTPANTVIYGKLYTWAAVMNGAASSNANPSGVQGICPTGWHIPSDAEWTSLENYLMANDYNYDGTTTGNKYAKSLASTTGWTSSSTTGAVGNTDYPAYRNKSNFTGLPGGYRDIGGTFNYVGYGGYWWSATEGDATIAWRRSLYYDGTDVSRVNYNKAYGFSVRCLRD